MPRYTSEAIILHTTDFLESDKIVHALTREQGLISAIAKGAHRSKKRFPGTLEPFCEVTLEVHQGRSSDLQRIESATLINANLGIREDLSLIGYSCVLLEVVKENLGPYDPSPVTYECLRKALSVMDPCRQWFPLWSISMVNILRSLGYGIDFESLARGVDHAGNGSWTSQDRPFYRGLHVPGEGCPPRVRCAGQDQCEPSGQEGDHLIPVAPVLQDLRETPENSHVPGKAA